MKGFFPTNIWFSTKHYGSWVHWRQHCSPGKSHKWLWVFPLTPHWRKGQNASEIIQIVVIRECYNENFSTLIRRSPTRTCCIDKNDQRQILHMLFFCWPFQCSTTFETSTFQKFIFAPVGKWILFLMLCNFSVFDGRYLFTIEHCHRASSASRVLECLLTKNGTRNFLKFSRYGFSFVVFRQQLSYASSSIPLNVTHVSSGTMHSLSILPLELWNFDNESKANANYFHRWKYFWERYQTVFHWKLRASELLDDGMRQVAKSSGQCISSVALHLVVFNS